MRVRLELDVLAGGRQIEPDQRAGARDAEDARGRRPGARQRRQVRPLVLAADRAAQLDAPRSGRVPET